MKRLCWALCIGLVSLGFSGHASGLSYPSRTIRIVVPFPAGGGVDIVARLQGEVAEVLKLRDVVERLRSSGNEPVGSAPQELDAFYKADMVKFAKIIADAKIPKLD